MLDLALGSSEGARVLGEAGEAIGLDLAALARRGGQAIFRNALAQPLLAASEVATWAALRQALPTPVLFAGYSLGELAAHGCAGALFAGQLAKLAQRRAALMDASADPSGLVALRGLPVARVIALCEALGAEVAIANGPDHCVVGGLLPVLAALELAARSAGATTVQRLPIGVAAHTSLLAGAVGPFAEALLASGITGPSVTVLAGVDAAAIRDRTAAVAALSLQLARRIEWSRCLASAAEMGVTVFLELGPGNALARMVQEVLPGVRVRSVSEFRTLEGVARWVERAMAG
jgi:[acyl-carrier-protein] S-malonyltransferase